MELSQRSAATTWFDDLRQHAVEHPYAAAGLLAGLALLVVLLGQSLINLLTTDNSLFTHYALLSGAPGSPAATLCAVSALSLTRASHPAEAAMLCFAAALLRAAAACSLLLPGIVAGESITGSAIQGGALVVFGML